MEGVMGRRRLGFASGLLAVGLYVVAAPALGSSDEPVEQATASTVPPQTRTIVAGKEFDRSGNWDRHQAQWRWARIAQKPLWEPLPEDADQAFTRYEGRAIGIVRSVVATASFRDQEDKHYLSDVVAGATLGYLVGRTVVRVNSRPIGHPGRATTLNVSPIVTRYARGLQASVVF
jgi:hypothetical protein